jgi:hypothetical protein
MSLLRGVYYSAVFAAWAALLGVFVCQGTVLRLAMGGVAATALVGSVVGLCIGVGIGLNAGAASGSVAGVARRALFGGLIGALGGALGGAVGELLFTLSDKLRPLGWMLLGMGVGVADGLFDRSPKKVRNGLIGGAAGGLVGGLSFDLVSRYAGGSELAARAAGFVLLGLCVGAMIGAVQLLLKRSWLTVVDGFGIGRQVILARQETPLGRAAAAGLSFGGRFGQELADEHATVRVMANGRYQVCPITGTSGTAVNGTIVTSPTLLQDGDVIRLGPNYVLFSEKAKGEPATPLQPSPTKRLVVTAVNDPPLSLAPPPRAIVTAVAVLPQPPESKPAPPPPLPVKADVTSPASAATARCPECGQPVIGKPGLRMCKQCGAMS